MVLYRGKSFVLGCTIVKESSGDEPKLDALALAKDINAQQKLIEDAAPDGFNFDIDVNNAVISGNFFYFKIWSMAWN